MNFAENHVVLSNLIVTLRVSVRILLHVIKNFFKILVLIKICKN